VDDHRDGGDSCPELLRLLGYAVRVSRSEALAAAGAFPRTWWSSARACRTWTVTRWPRGSSPPWPAAPCWWPWPGTAPACPSGGAGFDHVLTTADPTDLAALLTDYAPVVER
jgi:hypothetical protein